MDSSKTLISMNQVCKMTSLSRTAINKHRFARSFPAAVEIGHRKAFVLSEVEAWIGERINARRSYPNDKTVISIEEAA